MTTNDNTAPDLQGPVDLLVSRPAPEWECKAGGLKPLTQVQYDKQPEVIRRHYSRIAATQQPLTAAQRRRLWNNSSEHHADATSFAAFERIVELTERAHGINGGYKHASQLQDHGRLAYRASTVRPHPSEQSVNTI